MTKLTRIYFLLLVFELFKAEICDWPNQATLREVLNVPAMFPHRQSIDWNRFGMISKRLWNQFDNTPPPNPQMRTPDAPEHSRLSDAVISKWSLHGSPMALRGDFSGQIPRRVLPPVPPARNERLNSYPFMTMHFVGRHRTRRSTPANQPNTEIAIRCWCFSLKLSSWIFRYETFNLKAFPRRSILSNVPFLLFPMEPHEWLVISCASLRETKNSSTNTILKSF